MEGKNKFNTYVVSFDYPSSYSSVFLRLRSLMYDMNFSSIVADEYGIPRQLNENSFAITTSLAASEIEDLIRLKCLDLPDIDFDLSIMTVDDYFRQFLQVAGKDKKNIKMALFSKILIFYVIGVNISFVIIWFISHEKTHIRLLSAFLVGITSPMSLPVALLFLSFRSCS